MCAIETTPSIGTERLRLRAPKMIDAPRIADLANDLDVARMTSSMPYPYGLDDAHMFLNSLQAPDADQVFVIDHPKDGAIGMVGFTPAQDRPGHELGYWLGRDYWGQGYATEATTAALDWASSTRGRRFVVAGHFADNPASGAVLDKAGFLYTGEVKSRRSRARGETAPVRMMVWLA